jgi:hypothetical protein
VAVGQPPGEGGAAVSGTAKYWRATFDRNVATLASAGLMHVLGANLEITDAGRRRAEMIVGGKGPWPKTWAELLTTRLMVKSLGLGHESASKMKLLAKPDGLRAAILQKAYGLKIKGVPTSSRIRSALALFALERAFGNKLKAGMSGKSGLSAKAGRTLAGQLASPPREFGTDSRLIVALAAEYVGAETTDMAGLQAALLRRYVLGISQPAPPKVIKAKKAARLKAKKRALGQTVAQIAVPGLKPNFVAAAEIIPGPVVALSTAAPARISVAPIAASPPNSSPTTAETSGAIPRPDLPTFANIVRGHAVDRAIGWAGNRKAFISHIWASVTETRREWGLTEIEFKCMLAEAHRAGHIVLAHADLKDAATIKDVQASAVSFKNAVFHFVRVDD